MFGEFFFHLKCFTRIIEKRLVLPCFNMYYFASRFNHYHFEVVHWLFSC